MRRRETKPSGERNWLKWLRKRSWWISYQESHIFINCRFIPFKKEGRYWMRHRVRNGKVALIMIFEWRHLVTFRRKRTKEETMQSNPLVSLLIDVAFLDSRKHFFIIIDFLILLATLHVFLFYFVENDNKFSYLVYFLFFLIYFYYKLTNNLFRIAFIRIPYQTYTGVWN